MISNSRLTISKLRYYGPVVLSLVLICLILTRPARCLAYALSGLQLWFNRMIPTLFPFMVLSGIMVRMHLTDAFVSLLKPVLRPLFKVSPSCIYGMVIGFLCGFPMGAHVTAQLYETNQISKEEASFLLAFCNNIGPVYFLSFVMPTLGLSHPFYFLFGMYGLPLLYGLVLRYTVFRRRLSDIGRPSLPSTRESLLCALDHSVFTSLGGIAKLGGYMIFFNLLFILPELLFSGSFFQYALCCLLEITGGIGLIQNKAPVLILCILPFGGLSCIAQTYSMIQSTDLSIREYVMHKMILTAVTVCFYSLSAGKYFV